MNIVTINRQSLVFGDLHLDFPPEAVVDGEIKDKNLLLKSLNDFFGGHIIKNKEIKLIFAPEATFEKAFVVGENEMENIKKFYEEVPITNEKMLKKEFPQGATILAVAVNNEILQLITSVITDHKANISRVVPQSLIHTNLSLINTNKKIDVKYFLLILLLLIIFSGIAVYYLKFMNKKVERAEVVKEVETVAVATESAEVKTFKNKNELTILVLNGSGKAGEAGKVKKALEEAGFANIESGNASKSAVTKLFYRDIVSASDSGELKIIIEKLFDNVENSVSGDLKYDIELITG